MNSPLVSVVIPAYNQAEFLPSAIQSVLDQTYSNIELIVVNDASPDNTGEAVRQFNDPRVKYIVHEENRGLPTARNTGIIASSGDIILLLDADDFFHPQKIQTHCLFLEQHPEIGVTYNGRFDLDHSADTIRRLWRPPLTVGLADFILGFPFSPSDMVIRRDWVSRAGVFDGQYVCGGEDTDYPCRLALEGCQFASVDKVLNYRRYHSGRPRKNLRCRLEDVERALSNVFDDPRCPEEVLSLRSIALKHHLLILVSLALIQKETALGMDFLHQVLNIDPSLIEGEPCDLVAFLLREVIADEKNGHEAILRSVFDQLPQELEPIQNQYAWAVGQGYIEKGVRNIMWGRIERGRSHLEKAFDWGARVRKPYLDVLAAQLIDYEVEFGSEAAQLVLNDLTNELKVITDEEDLQYLLGLYFVNSAFRNFRNGRYKETVPSVLKAVKSDKIYLKNRGVLSLLSQSLLKSTIQGLNKEK